MPDFIPNPSFISRAEYSRAFARVRKEQTRGNSFLTNLTFPSELNPGTALNLRELYHSVSAPYRLWIDIHALSTPASRTGADILLPAGAADQAPAGLPSEILVFSPETFVRTGKGRIYTFPMKGTAHVAPGEDREEANRRLLDDPKETAEHITVVDLLRNDLGRVADDIRVEDFRYISRVPLASGELLQVSSRISGRLADDWESRIGTIFADLLPAGSVSGAPKRETCRIISEAENRINPGSDILPRGRGYYTGIAAIYDGREIDSSVLIRFIERRNGISNGHGPLNHSAALHETENHSALKRSAANTDSAAFNPAAANPADTGQPRSPHAVAAAPDAAPVATGPAPVTPGTENRSRYFFRSGGGITIYSDEESEYRELIHKVQIPLRRSTGEDHRGTGPAVHRRTAAAERHSPASSEITRAGTAADSAPARTAISTTVSAAGSASATGAVAAHPAVSATGTVAAPPAVSATGTVAAPPAVSATGTVAAPPAVSATGAVAAPPAVSAAGSAASGATLIEQTKPRAIRADAVFGAPATHSVPPTLQYRRAGTALAGPAADTPGAQPRADRLVETMLWTAGSGFGLLDYHYRRFRSSLLACGWDESELPAAGEFAGLVCDSVAAARRSGDAALIAADKLRVRLLYNPEYRPAGVPRAGGWPAEGGEQFAAAPEVSLWAPRKLSRIGIIEAPHAEYRLKREDRSLFEDLHRMYPGYDEIIITRNDLLTDGTWSNLYYLPPENPDETCGPEPAERIPLTPESPLLEGCRRQFCLDAGQLKPAPLRWSDILSRGGRIGFMNALNPPGGLKEFQVDEILELGTEIP